MKKIKGYIRKQPQKRDDIEEMSELLYKLNEIKDNEVKPDLANSIGSVVQLVTDLNEIKDEVTGKIDSKLEEVEEQVESLKQTVEEVKSIKKGEDGKDAEVDYEYILGQIPIPEDGKDADEDEIVEKVLSKIPKFDEKKLRKDILKSIPDRKADLKVIQENIEIDPMSVIDKIMALPEEKLKKLRLRTDNIDGLSQTISAFHNQLGRGYLHGGGISNITGLVQAGTNITIDGSGTATSPYVINSTGGGGGGLTVGTTTITSGTSTRILYDNAGVLGEYTISGSGTSVAMSTSPTFATSITGSYLTASEILITDGSKNIVSAPVATYPSLTELTYVKGVTSAIQTQLNGKQSTITPAALTKTDDTNVTLTLGGSPSTALLSASSLTLGWTGTLSGTRGGTGVNNGSSTITLGGNLTTSGANALTLTTTGATNVTLPTTGTLVNTAVTSLGSLGTVDTTLTGPLYATAGVLSTLPTRVSVSTFSTTSTSYTDITGLNKTLATNTTYTFRIMGEWTSNNNSGQATIGFTVPAGATATMTRFMGTTSSAINSSMQNTNNQAANVAIGTANGIRTVMASGIVVMGGTAGDLQIRLASNNASYTATVQNIALDVTPF